MPDEQGQASAAPTQGKGASPAASPISEAARLDVDHAIELLHSSTAGLSDDEVARRRKQHGANVLPSHDAGAWQVLIHQLNSPLLLLLAITAAISFALGDHTDSIIIAIILAASIGLGFMNEYRAARTARSLRNRIQFSIVVTRGGQHVRVNATDLVPGDLVHMHMGEVVPADLRLLQVKNLSCDEGILTGESASVDKSSKAIPDAQAITDMANCAFMGTIVSSGEGKGIVVATGKQTQLGAIAAGLTEQRPETTFQRGLRQFSLLLMRVALVLTALIMVTNLALKRDMITSVMFALSIAIGITPQLLPAVVSTSLASGTKALAKVKVLVKRLVCIEDLGDVDTLVTDKTGTLTDGHVTYEAAFDCTGKTDDTLAALALLASAVELDASGTAVGGNDLDRALAESPAAALARDSRLSVVDTLPFDHERQRSSALVTPAAASEQPKIAQNRSVDPQPSGPQPTSELGIDGPTLLVKGAPEKVLDACSTVPDEARHLLDQLFGRGERVIAVASRPAPGTSQISATDEQNLTLRGFLTFNDKPKASARESLAQLHALGVTVKLATGDNAIVAKKVCTDLGFENAETLTGKDVDALDDTALRSAAERATIFARVTPEQKARVIRVLRGKGHSVGFLGDGVNDALALHAADVGISVDTGADVAKEAADVILLDKDLGVLGNGIREGRRIFANTIKYVLMGTSSNFGNMFSAAGASAILTFLPMLPGQILLNNLLYDVSQLAIPTDHVDEERLERPTRWDIDYIRSFMMLFGPISSIFDFITFAVMLGIFNADPMLFRSGWFLESLATQTLIVFSIRTQRIPFWRSRPSAPLVASILGILALAVGLLYTPLAPILGFTQLPPAFFALLAVLMVVYLTLVELGKRLFFRQRATANQRAELHAKRVQADRIRRRLSALNWPHD